MEIYPDLSLVNASSWSLVRITLHVPFDSVPVALCTRGMSVSCPLSAVRLVRQSLSPPGHQATSPPVHSVVVVVVVVHEAANRRLRRRPPIAEIALLVLTAAEAGASKDRATMGRVIVE